MSYMSHREEEPELLSLDEMRELEAEMGLDDYLSQNGLDPRCTPLDTLMSAPVSVGLGYADAMENYG